jgi:hypothetical protein
MMRSPFAQNGFDVARLRHHEGMQFEERINVGALLVAGFQTRCRHRFTKRAASEFPGIREIGKCLLQPELVGWLRIRQARNFKTQPHDETIAARGYDGNPICRRPAVLPSRDCDISAGAFVAKESQRTDATRNEEAWFSRLRFDAPKLCLGETHVPLRFSSMTRKNASGCVEYPLCTLLVVFSHR